MGYIIEPEYNIDIVNALAADHSFVGINCRRTAGENVAFPDLVYLKISDGKFWKVDADAAATTEGLLAIATETIAADATGKFLLIGFIRDDTWNWATQGAIFASCTAGALTQTAPSGSGDQVRKVGQPLTADIMWFCPDQTIVEIA